MKELKDWAREYDDTLNFTEYLSIMMPELGVQQHRDFAICCPIHEENTPSFKYSENMGLWTCFGACKTSGGVVKFHHMMLQKQYGEGLTLYQAMKNIQQLFPHILPEMVTEQSQDMKVQSLVNEFERYFRQEDTPMGDLVKKDEDINRIVLRYFLEGYEE